MKTNGIEEKRQAVYSSLCRFASEAVPLRKRALHRVILGALIGSHFEDPFRIGRIKENLSIGTINIGLRVETIQEALNELISEEKIEHKLLLTRHAYYLTDKGKEEIKRIISPSEEVFNRVIDYLFKDTSSFLPLNVASNIFRSFACECFAKFGRQIAKSVTGTISREDLVTRVDAREALEFTLKEYDINNEQRETLEVRCQHFLKSSQPDCDKLKFYLTQGYYFTQLIGFEHAKFNPLAEEAFAGSILYIDTNVVLVGLLLENEEASQFSEMVGLAKKIGIELRVSKATINEAFGVIENRMPQIRKIVDVIPEKLVERTSDQILQTYYKLLEKDSDFTPDKFFSIFEKIEKILLNNWGVKIDGRDRFEIIDGRDIALISKIMNEEAEKSRGWGKSETVLEHDVAHYLIVKDLREQNQKAWFLTRDRSFEAVSSRLIPDGPSFSFSHIGFLQSISPFITTPEEELTLSDVLSQFISDQITPFESLFDISELSLMAEFHEDVMATPPDQLVMAFDYIKSRTLKGAPYKEADIPNVSLALKKFLSVDKDQQLKTLHEEKARLAKERNSQIELRKEVEAEVLLANDREDKLKNEVEALKGDLSFVQSNLKAIKTELESERLNAVKENQDRRLNHTIFGVVIAWIFISQISTISNNLTDSIPYFRSHLEIIEIFFKTMACLFFSIPAVRYIRNTKWKNEIKVLGISFVVITFLAIVNPIAEEDLSWWSDIVGVGMTIATLVSAIILWRNK